MHEVSGMSIDKVVWIGMGYSHYFAGNLSLDLEFR